MTFYCELNHPHASFVHGWRQQVYRLDCWFQVCIWYPQKLWKDKVAGNKSFSLGALVSWSEIGFGVHCLKLKAVLRNFVMPERFYPKLTLVFSFSAGDRNAQWHVIQLWWFRKQLWDLFSCKNIVSRISTFCKNSWLSADTLITTVWITHNGRLPQRFKTVSSMEGSSENSLGNLWSMTVSLQLPGRTR